mmetsp:Transcript_46282/g.75770  ORF Transcript_46282/g.75770 Transcript_46282/m.75770 type:complete len:96 (+) Transcript_46282:978-1265(+)
MTPILSVTMTMSCSSTSSTSTNTSTKYTSRQQEQRDYQQRCLMSGVGGGMSMSDLISDVHTETSASAGGHTGGACGLQSDSGILSATVHCLKQQS